MTVAVTVAVAVAIDSAAQRLEDALELADLAERMVRARLQRERPGMSDREIDEARSALEVIDQRGYARGKRLVDEIERALSELGAPRSR